MWRYLDEIVQDFTSALAVCVFTKLEAIWVLADNNLVYYTVPVPAAVWLFGSAFAGLVGVSCRKRS